MLEEGVRQLAKGTNFAAFTTLLPDGRPMTHVMWVDCDDEHVLINTEVHRQKARNLRRDPRVAVTIWDAADPYRYAEVRGEVVETVTGPEARAHIDALSMKYHGHEYRNRIQSERLLVRIKPLRQQVRKA
ncbi:MAG TPA: PPOX class F420-dependent oxidoreductase [Actinomycetes bacterium]|nr:PPOX class F420-dependent oxidoreductase [Actinomycetes bacterium]